MDIIFDIDRFNFFAEHLTREYRVRNNRMELYELVIIHKHTFIILIIGYYYYYNYTYCFCKNVKKYMMMLFINIDTNYLN